MKSKLPFILIILVAAATAVATVVESVMGTDAAKALVYNSVWYFLLWFLTACGGLWLILKKKMWKRPSIMLLHISFLVILLGATVTRVTGYNGVMHIREGEGSKELIYKNSQGEINFANLPIGIFLMQFQIQYDKDGQTPKDYISKVVIGDKDKHITADISMNRIARFDNYRIYQTSYDDDLHGTVLTVSYDPWGTAITYLGYLLLAIGIVCDLSHPILRKGGSNTTEAIRETHTTWGKIKERSAWLIAILLSSYMVIALLARPLVPVLRSPMLVIHVSVICIAYVLLIVSFVKRSVLRIAVYLLAVGIFLGAIWANISWGTYWSWDPKESWALVTLIIYSLPLHKQSFPWFQSQKHYRIYSIVALLSLMMTYFGCNYLLAGMHSYIN